MTGLISLLALGAFVFGLVNLVGPTGWLGISSRRRAGLLIGASFLLFLLAAIIERPVGDDEPIATTAPESQGTTSTVAATTNPSPETTEALPNTTTRETGSTVTTTTPSPGPEDGFGPPVAGPSGDPNDFLEPSAEVVMVVDVIDGDTLDVIRTDGSPDRVRLIGINAPERDECWAAEATSVLTVLTSGDSEIGITRDVSDRDQFGRLLRYLWVGSMSVNEELVRRGAAISRRYPPDVAMSDRLEAAQQEAREAGVGLWAPDACGPSSDADLHIVDWRPDATGNDSENLNDEWIRLGNQGEEIVDLTGWSIKDESATNRYSFPSGFSIIPGEEVIVYSGCGEDFGTSLYWCSVGSAIWNNDGDTAFLIDPSGNTHVSRNYSP